MECLFRFQPVYPTLTETFLSCYKDHYYPLPLKYKNKLLFTTQSSDISNAGIYSFCLKTHKAKLLIKYPTFLSFTGHGAILFNHHKIIVFGGYKQQSLLQYDLERNEIDFALKNYRYYPSILKPLSKMTSYPLIFEVYDMCYLIYSNYTLLVVTPNKIMHYNWNYDFFPWFYYKKNAPLSQDDMYFFGAYGNDSKNHSIQQNMIKEKIFSGKFDINKPLTYYRNNYAKVTINWQNYFQNIVEFVPTYKVLSPFNDAIFILIYEISVDTYYIDLNLQQKHKINLALPAEFTSNWSYDIFVSETNTNELNFVSLKGGIFYRLNPLNLIPCSLFEYYHTKNCRKCMDLIEKYCETIKQYTIPMVVKKLIALYYPLYIMKI